MPSKKVFVVFLTAVFLFTFRNLQIPPGIETDEGVIAHNAALISKTGRDQNGRFMPMFILSSDKMDWKQPVSIYLTAIYFKVFGMSLWVFKLVNVSVALISLCLMWILLKTLFGEKEAVWGTIVLITTPMVVISTRIGTEAISPLLFATAWLLTIALYRKNGRLVNLVLSALTLGVGFYSYKGMRLVIPPWTLMTMGYIYHKSARDWGKFFRSVGVFTIVLFPFFSITPFLELKYPGAVFERATLALESYRHYAYYWLSNLDLGFLFLQGDVGRIFSVELFGSFLLGALPFFLVGIKKAVDKMSFFTFILGSYLLTPVLFGMAGSMGYGHRLVAIIPAYVIITTLGIRGVRRGWNILLALFFAVNFFNFFTYYFYRYPQLHETKTAFSNNLDRAYYRLATLSKKEQLAPYIQENVHQQHGEGNLFFEAAYFDNPLTLWKQGSPLPPKSILLTNMEVVDGLEKSNINASPLFIQKSR